MHIIRLSEENSSRIKQFRFFRNAFEAIFPPSFSGKKSDSKIIEFGLQMLGFLLYYKALRVSGEMVH